MALKWGIVTAGKISHDFVLVLASYSYIDIKDEHEVVCVASNKLKAAQKFAKLHGIPVFYEGYENVAKDPNVEIVFIGGAHSQHYEIVTLMLEHGKHVLCEKPLTFNEQQSKKLIELAKKLNLFLMEAISSRFYPPYNYLRSEIENGTLGVFYEVNVGFGLHINPRNEHKDHGGAALLDQGIYAVQLAQWIFREPPAKITANGNLNEKLVDVEINVTLEYEIGATVNISANSTEDKENIAVFNGTKGTIILHDFWCPRTMTPVDGMKRCWSLSHIRGEPFFPNCGGLTYVADTVRDCIRAGRIECDIISHAETLTIARIQDEIRRQMGYSVDIH